MNFQKKEPIAGDDVGPATNGAVGEATRTVCGVRAPTASSTAVPLPSAATTLGDTRLQLHADTRGERRPSCLLLLLGRVEEKGIPDLDHLWPQLIKRKLIFIINYYTIN
jgi:hypothetical protein